MACVYDKKKHDLQPIHYHGHMVIKWCAKCGAIVGDAQEDGRVFPGSYFKMIFPKIALEHNNAETF